MRGTLGSSRVVAKGKVKAVSHLVLVNPLSLRNPVAALPPRRLTRTTTDQLNQIKREKRSSNPLRPVVLAGASSKHSEPQTIPKRPVPKTNHKVMRKENQASREMVGNAEEAKHVAQATKTKHHNQRLSKRMPRLANQRQQTSRLVDNSSSL